MASATAKEAENYATAGGIAEEVLTSIRTVVAFNGQKFECDRFPLPSSLAHNFESIKLKMISWLLLNQFLTTINYNPLKEIKLSSLVVSVEARP